MKKTIHGKRDNKRISSRILEEEIKHAIKAGHKHLTIKAYGQHGIGGRLSRGSKKNPIYISIEGQAGQRVGSLGYPNTIINVMGPASDDVGWLNAGAEIIVHGNAGNGVANAMAQGKIYIAGTIGSRGMTITKHNPKYPPPELWILGSVGDYFGEFMAGGICVICGHNAQNPHNILGYRPLVGMVGGKVFFRGNYEDFSSNDAKFISIDDNDWQWLVNNLELYLTKINQQQLLNELSKRDEWQLIIARSHQEKRHKPRMPMHSFRTDIWEKELGEGGLLGDLSSTDRSQIPLITTGDLRRFIPIWKHKDKCIDCRICLKTCPEKAISRREKNAKAFEYTVNDDKCIGCGFCENICPCDVWEMIKR